MKVKHAGYIIVLLSLTMLVGSCREPAAGMGKSPVYLTADGGNKWGTIIDVYTPGVLGGVTDDYFDITITSNYKNPALTSPYADVYLYEYRVTYYRLDGNPNVPEGFAMHFTAKVPAGGTYQMQTLFLRRDAKLKSPLKELVFGGGEGTIEFNAVIDFYGEDLMGNKLSTRFVLDITAEDT